MFKTALKIRIKTDRGEPVTALCHVKQNLVDEPRLLVEGKPKSCGSRRRYDTKDTPSTSRNVSQCMKARIQVVMLPSCSVLRRIFLGNGSNVWIYVDRKS